jgi:hypothetical protein
VIMAGPKGNQNAKLPPNRGRPPKYGSNEEMIALGEELIGWLLKKREKKQFVTHLSEFYVFEKDMSRSEWRAIRQRIEFLPYYEKALDIMSYFTINNKDLSTAYGSRYLSLYCGELRDHEKEIIKERAEIEAAAKAKEVANITDKEQEQNAAIIRGVIAMQEALKKNNPL